MDSNPHKKDLIPFEKLSSTNERGKKLDSNLGIWRSEEHMKDLNPPKKDSNPIYKMKLLVEDQTKGFESLSYEFKSPSTLNSNFAKEI